MHSTNHLPRRGDAPDSWNIAPAAMRQCPRDLVQIVDADELADGDRNPGHLVAPVGVDAGLTEARGLHEPEERSVSGGELEGDVPARVWDDRLRDPFDEAVLRTVLPAADRWKVKRSLLFAPRIVGQSAAPRRPSCEPITSTGGMRGDGSL